MHIGKILKKSIPATMLVLLVMLVFIFFSCRKEDFIPVPDGPTQSITPVKRIPPDVFSNKPIQIMSSYERSEQTRFPAELIHNLGKGLNNNRSGKYMIEGPGLEIFFKVADVAWEAYDYLHTETKFDEVYAQLDDIQDQITKLSSTIEAMGASFNIAIDDLTSFISSGDLNTQIGFVKTAMDSSTMDGLLYYPKKAREYQADPTNADLLHMMGLLHDYAPTWAENTYHNVGSTSMKNIIVQMQEDLCPTLGTGDNALHAFAKTLIPKCQNKVTDSITAMNAYLLLESYFLTVVNYQFQAAIVYINAANMIDTTGQLASDFYGEYIGGIIPGEVKVFLDNVDYITINLAEYRTEKRFKYDMQFAEYGIAPDNMLSNVYARSQFVANLLYAASGKPYPAVSGHIFIPNEYAPGGGLTPNQISLQVGGRSIISNASLLSSVIPYTAYDPPVGEAERVCKASNKWAIYRFNNYDTDWSGSRQAISLGDVDENTPWRHDLDVSGEGVTPLYYNPGDPDQTSPVITDACTIQFAYFSASWQWGYLTHYYNTDKYSKVYDNVYLRHYDSRFPSGMRYYCPTFPTRWHTNENESVFSLPVVFSDIVFSKDIGNLTSHGFLPSNATMPIKALYDTYIFNNGLNFPYSLPPKAGPGGTNAVMAWAEYSGAITEDNQYPSDAINKVYISIGTSHNSGDYANGYIVGDIIEDVITLKPGTTILPVKFASLTLTSPDKAWLGVQYVYLNNIVDSHNFDFSFDFKTEIVFTGLYNLE